MNLLTYTAPSAADLKEKEVKPSYVSKARELGARIAEEKWDPRKWNGTGFYNNPFRDLLSK